MKLKDYLDRAKSRADCPRDTDLATQLGVERPAISWWRTGRCFPSDLQMYRLAILAEISPSIAILELNSWRTKSVECASIYRDLVRKLDAPCGCDNMAH